MNTSQLKQRMDQYHTHLVNRTKYTKGWDVDYETRKSQTKIVFRCIHGKKYREDFYPDSLEHLPSTKGLADQCFQRAIKWCKGEHVDLQPNTWYSTPKLTPYSTIKYASGGTFVAPMYFKMDYTPLIKMFDDVGKQVNVIVTGGSWGFTQSGTGSILGELGAACPALHTVNRKCPACKPDTGYGSIAFALNQVIQHLNDSHQWSREKIADWLDIIAIDDPDVDLTIKPKEKKSEQPSPRPDTKEVIVSFGDYGPVTLGGNAIKVGID